MSKQNQTSCFFQGQVVSKEFADDRGFLYADGVFTTLKFIDNQPINLDAHIQRLIADAQRLSFEVAAPKILENQVRKVIKQVALSDGMLRITATRPQTAQLAKKSNLARPPFFIHLRALSYWPEKLVATVCQSRLSRNPVLAGIKHLNRLELVLAGLELSRNKCQATEGIVKDSDGFVIEGLIANIFWYKQGVFYTPSVIWAGVNGLTRRKIIANLRGAGAEVVIDEFKMSEVLLAEQVWMCNSVRGIKELSQIDGHLFASGSKISKLLGNID